MTPWAAVPTTAAVLAGAARRLSPIGLKTVRGPLAWIGTVVDDPLAGVVETDDVGVVTAVVVEVAAFFPLQAATRTITVGRSARRRSTRRSTVRSTVHPLVRALAWHPDHAR